MGLSKIGLHVTYRAMPSHCSDGLSYSHDVVAIAGNLQPYPAFHVVHIAQKIVILLGNLTQDLKLGQISDC